MANKGFVVDVQLHAVHLKAIHVVPERDVRRNEIWVSIGSNAQGGVRWNHQTIRSKVAVTSVDDRIKHGLEQQRIAHPFGNNDVDLINGKGDLFNLATDASRHIVSVEAFRKVCEVDIRT